MPLHYWAYLGFAVLVVIAPGPDFAVVMKNSLGHGRNGSRPGIYASFGVVTSLLIQGLAAALGVAAIIVHSPVAFDVLKIAGAVYLTYLGIQSIRSAVKRRREQQEPQEQETSAADEERNPVNPRDLLRAYRQGLLSNITNPKVLAFYFSLLPQFD